MIIKNLRKISQTKERKIALQIINVGLNSLRYENFLKENFKVQDSILKIKDKEYNLKNFENVYLIGFGKGSFAIGRFIKRKLKKYLKESYLIDVSQKPQKNNLNHIEIKGTHPLPSKTNLQFTQKVIKRFENKLTEKDLVIVVICGGGSAMLVSPAKIDLNEYININQQLLKSGADIYEMNIVRKHLDRVKGGGFAKILFPAKVISLIFSDVPGNDLNFIASGPTIKDKTNLQQAIKITQKFKIKINKDWLIETPKENKYFKNVDNILMISNLTALKAMEEKAKNFNLKVKIFTDDLKGEVSEVAKKILREIKKVKENILLFGGETTVKVRGQGKGGRNQELVLWFLKYLLREKENYLIISINSDGWDNTPFAGALGDKLTLEKAKKQNLNIDEFLKNNDSFNFFKKVNDGIITGRLPFNVADLILVFKNENFSNSR